MFRAANRLQEIRDHGTFKSDERAILANLVTGLRCLETAMRSYKRRIK